MFEIEVKLTRNFEMHSKINDFNYFACKFCNYNFKNFTATLNSYCTIYIKYYSRRTQSYCAVQ